MPPNLFDLKKEQVPKLEKTTVRSPHAEGQIFHCIINAQRYETGDNYDISKSLKDGRSKVMKFEHKDVSGDRRFRSAVWTSKADKARFGQYKIKPSDVAKINFDNMSRKLQTAKPSKGRKKRLEANKEDNEIFLEWFVRPAMGDKNIKDLRKEARNKMMNKE